MFEPDILGLPWQIAKEIVEQAQCRYTIKETISPKIGEGKSAQSVGVVARICSRPLQPLEITLVYPVIVPKSAVTSSD